MGNGLLVGAKWLVHQQCLDSFIFFYCITLELRLVIILSALLLSFNTEGTQLAQTLVVLYTHPQWYTAHRHGVNQGQSPSYTLVHLNEFLNKQCWFVSLRSFVLRFGSCLSCSCQMRMWGTIWQHVAWTSHHCWTLPCAVIGYELPTLYMLTESLLIPYTSKGEQFSKWVTKLELPLLCSCSAFALNHMTEH
jgi:hypothetical protein